MKALWWDADLGLFATVPKDMIFQGFGREQCPEGV